MNIAYFRKTDKKAEEVLLSLKEGLKKRGIAVAAEKKLPLGSVLVQFVDEARTDEILKSDRTMLGFVPMAAMIEVKDGKVSVGITNPRLLAGAPHLETPAAVIEDLTDEMRGLVNEAAGVGEPRVEKVKLYSTAACPYCKMEKDYLEKNKVAFELVMVDADRNAAEDMVRKSGHTGVPQTEIAYDDGDEELVIGFDKGRLNQLLGIGK